MWGFGQSGNEAYGFDINRYSGDLYQHASTSPTRLNSSFGAINYSSAGAKALYNGVVLSLRAHYQRGFVDATYNYSNAKDNTQVYPTNDIEKYYGTSEVDAPSHFALKWNYELPNYRNERAARLILGGWSISGVTVLQSGRPWSVFTSNPFDPVITTVNGTKTVTALKPDSGDYNGDGINNDWPDVQSYHIATSRSARLKTGVFTSGQFTQPAILGAEGNEKPDQFRSPAYENTDLVLMKNIPLHERYSIQLRGDYFNAFNHPNLLAPSHNLADPNFGKCTSQLNPRWLQIVAKFVF
jgi:hypothetical protein